MGENQDEKIMDKLTENIIRINNKIENPRSVLDSSDVMHLSQALLNLILARKELEYIDNS